MARLGSGTTTDTTSTSNELYYAGEAFRLAYDVGAGTGSRRVPTDFNGFKITAKAIAVSVTNGDTNTAVPYGLCQIDSNAANDTFTTKADCATTWIPGKRPVRFSTEATLVGGHPAAAELIGDALRDLSTRDGECEVTGSGTGEYLTQVLCEASGTCSYGAAMTPDFEHDETETDCRLRSDFLEFTPNEWTPNAEKGEGRFNIYIPSDILRLVGFLEEDAPQPGSPLYIAYSIDYTEKTGTNSAETRVIETDIIGFRWTPMFDITD